LCAAGLFFLKGFREVAARQEWARRKQAPATPPCIFIAGQMAASSGLVAWQESSGYTQGCSNKLLIWLKLSACMTAIAAGKIPHFDVLYGPTLALD
tara:strand:- start:54 stop:341 length:288 start_codon:yes stop_codon:yes gene_type:complete